MRRKIARSSEAQDEALVHRGALRVSTRGEAQAGTSEGGAGEEKSSQSGTTEGATSQATVCQASAFDGHVTRWIHNFTKPQSLR